MLFQDVYDFLGFLVVAGLSLQQVDISVIKRSWNISILSIVKWPVSVIIWLLLELSLYCMTCLLLSLKITRFSTLSKHSS